MPVSFEVKHWRMIGVIPPEAESVHVRFRPDDLDLLRIYHHCPNLRRLHIKPRYKEKISNTTRTFLVTHDVRVIADDEC